MHDVIADATDGKKYTRISALDLSFPYRLQKIYLLERSKQVEVPFLPRLDEQLVSKR